MKYNLVSDCLKKSWPVGANLKKFKKNSCRSCVIDSSGSLVSTSVKAFSCTLEVWGDLRRSEEIWGDHSDVKKLPTSSNRPWWCQHFVNKLGWWISYSSPPWGNWGLLTGWCYHILIGNSKINLFRSRRMAGKYSSGQISRSRHAR